MIPTYVAIATLSCNIFRVFNFPPVAHWHSFVNLEFFWLYFHKFYIALQSFIYRLITTQYPASVRWISSKVNCEYSIYFTFLCAIVLFAYKIFPAPTLRIVSIAISEWERLSVFHFSISTGWIWLYLFHFFPHWILSSQLYVAFGFSFCFWNALVAVRRFGSNSRWMKFIQAWIPPRFMLVLTFFFS